jgi:two-component system sensor kinase FixL
MNNWPASFDVGALARLLAETSADIVCLATSHGEPLYLNPAGRQLLGIDADMPADAIVLKELYDAESWEVLRDTAVPEVKKSGRWQGICRLRNRASSETIEAEAQLFRVKTNGGDGPTCLVFIHRPAAEDPRAALAEAQARKRAILESSLDPIITIDHTGVITEFNRAAEAVFGHPREKVLGTKPADVLFPPAFAPGRQDRIERYLEAGEGSFVGKRVEVTAVRADGEIFNAEMAMTIGHEGGRPVLTFFVRDISQRKQAELQRERYAAELERSNRELEQFAYVASHDLSEPLRKIRSFGQRLEESCAAALDETGAECLRRMISAAERMQALIDGLLTLSRAASRKQELAAVDLAEVARQVVADLESQIERVGGQVELGRLPTIQADPLQMRQLLQNLIANGLKFHRPDAPPVVKVSGRFAHGRADRPAGLSPADEQCVLTVEDNGIGLEAKDQQRIFDLFVRLNPRGTFEGVGIGLALCRKIVERHGGRISARGAPGRGSVFEIRLPVAQPPADDRSKLFPDFSFEERRT